MDNLLVLALAKLAAFLDQLVPMQGGRSTLIAVLTVVGNLALYLTGKETAQQAAQQILLAFGLVFAALHLPTPPAPPTPPATPPAA